VKDRAGNFPEYYADLACIVDDVPRAGGVAQASPSVGGITMTKRSCFP
jgi:hypothetical protein